MPFKIIGYIPIDRAQRPCKSRISKLIDVTRAKDDSDRRAKLIMAAKSFNHHDKAMHDADVKAGAISIACNILRSCTPFFVDKTKQIQSLCKILLRLLRCSDERAKVSFCLDGSTLILSLLEIVEINYRLGKKSDATKCLVLAQHVVERLIGFSRVPLTMVRRCEALLSSLVSFINGATGKIVMHDCVKLIASLSEHTQNKQVLLAFPGLMESVEVGSRHICEAVREESARITMNLAWEAKNKTILAHRNECMIDMVLESILGRGQSNASIAYAVRTLGHLATEKSNKILIVQHKNGLVVNALLDMAFDISSSSKVILTATGKCQLKVSINAIQYLGSLICRATASQIGNLPGLLSKLSTLACFDNKLAVMAAISVRKLAAFIRSNEQCHRDLLRALVTMSYGKRAEVRKWTAKAFVEQSSFPKDRVKMIAHKGLLSALTVLADDENETVRGHSQDVLCTLAVVVANARGMTVEGLLRCVLANKESKKSPPPRYYSPTSVMEFSFDGF